MEEEEKWFDIPEFKGLLQISSLDRVREYIVIKVKDNPDIIYINRILTEFNHLGYRSIRYKSISRKVCRLKAETFLKEFTPKKYIEYKDGNPDNLELENLIIADERKCPKGQGTNNWQSKLTDEKVLGIVKLIQEGKNAKYIADFYQICQPNIYRIAQKKIWKHVERPVVYFKAEKAKIKRNKRIETK